MTIIDNGDGTCRREGLPAKTLETLRQALDPLRAGRTIRFGGSRFVRRLEQGECWMPWRGGVIIAHPDRKPVWLHVVDGLITETVIEALSQTELKCDGQG